jgi:hypothetical protein
MTQSERENRKPYRRSFFSGFARTLPDARAEREARHEPAALRTLGSPGAGWSETGIGFETGFEAGFVFACAVDFPFKNEIARSLKARAVEF